jgi:actin
MDFDQAVVLDNGTDTIKAGFAFDDAPRTLLHSVIGRPRAQGLLIGVETADVFVGSEALKRRGVLRLHAPFVRGRIENFQYAEMLWYDCFFEQLKTCPFSPALLTTCPVASDASRLKTTEIMFDTFLVPGLFLTPAPLLSVLATGRTSGLGVEVGEGYSSIMPVIEGFPLKHAIEKL